jgi:glucosylceramidase
MARRSLLNPFFLRRPARLLSLWAAFGAGLLGGCQRPAATAPTASTTSSARPIGSVEAWLTTADQTLLFQRQAPIAFGPVSKATTTPPADPATPVITVDDATTYQTIDGFGYCLTGGSAQLLRQMDAANRAALLHELFDTVGNSIGVSYLRVSIGASDLDAEVFSYDDLPAGQTDPNLAHFSLAPDRQHLIPVLKEILAINPHLKLLGSPWSPPTWMKTNGESKGGSLKPEFYAAYAQYFVKYLQGMRAEGIRLDAITPQNEPLHPGNNPSLLMLAPEQAVFIGQHLGPALRAAGLDTKIICYDHNADRPDYPLTVLADAQARPFVAGSAFHLYAGPIEALSQVHDAYPDKNVYFTEQWVGAPGNFPTDLAWHVRTLVIGATRNWARTVLEWNLAADPQQNPHTPGGCTQCLGAITLAKNTVSRNPAYYVIAHAARHVRPGSVRLASPAVAGLPNVAFRTPSGQRVLIVQNDHPAPQAFSVSFHQQAFTARLAPGAVGTYVW